MAKISVQRLFRRTFLITFTFLTVCILIYGYSSIKSNTKQLLKHNTSRLEVYTDSFAEELGNMRRVNRETVYSNPSFRLLARNILSDSALVQEEYYFRRMIESQTPDYGITVFSKENDETVLYKFGAKIASGTNGIARYYSFLHSLGNTPETFGWIADDQWFPAKKEGMVLLAIRNSSHGGALVSGISIQHYLDCNPFPAYSDYSSVVVYSENEILLGTEEPDISPQQLFEHSHHQQTLLDALKCGNLVSSKYLDNYGIGIAVITPLTDLAYQVLPQICYAVLILFLTTGIISAVYYFMRKFLIYPIQEIAAISNQLRQNGNMDEYNLPSSRYEEYDAIRERLFGLKDQISALEIEKANKEFEKEHALLQYFQLQTRSHFFLNCLKSLYSMLENGEHDRMKSMLLGFSNHLRFIFHDNMATVPLEAELREVSDYYRINQLDASRILIIRRDVPEELLDCQVPPLIIQTFLENSLKYNSKKGEPLIFQIKVARVSRTEGEYLQIHCSDNGVGYSQEVLNTINRDLPSGFDAYNIGINNLRRRMAIVYKNNCQTAFYNLPGGGACSALFIPMIREENTSL